MNIHDIARLAGVSASTVSKVMNGKDRDISEETKKKFCVLSRKKIMFHILNSGKRKV